MNATIILLQQQRYKQVVTLTKYLLAWTSQQLRFTKKNYNSVNITLPQSTGEDISVWASSVQVRHVNHAIYTSWVMQLNLTLMSNLKLWYTHYVPNMFYVLFLIWCYLSSLPILLSLIVKQQYYERFTLPKHMSIQKVMGNIWFCLVHQ